MLGVANPRYTAPRGSKIPASWLPGGGWAPLYNPRGWQIPASWLPGGDWAPGYTASWGVANPRFVCHSYWAWGWQIPASWIPGGDESPGPGGGLKIFRKNPPPYGFRREIFRKKSPPLRFRGREKFFEKIPPPTIACLWAAAGRAEPRHMLAYASERYSPLWRCANRIYCMVTWVTTQPVYRDMGNRRTANFCKEHSPGQTRYEKKKLSRKNVWAKNFRPREGGRTQKKTGSA